MSDASRFMLRIEGVVPDDLSMRRLAAYLEEFAKLLGEEASTHFDGILPGSAILAARTPSVAVPKVRTRLVAARDDAQADGRRAINCLDDMLAEDNASGSLSEEGQTGIIIRFPGSVGRSTPLPAVTEAGTLQGELVRIGGRDDTAHATLRDGDRYYHCQVSKDVARALGKYLFGPTIRVYGKGRWRRTGGGAWELVADFRVTKYEVLDNASLQDAARKLRAAGGFGVTDDAEAFSALREMRAD